MFWFALLIVSQYYVTVTTQFTDASNDVLSHDGYNLQLVKFEE